MNKITGHSENSNLTTEWTCCTITSNIHFLNKKWNIQMFSKQKTILKIKCKYFVWQISNISNYKVVLNCKYFNTPSFRQAHQNYMSSWIFPKDYYLLKKFNAALMWSHMLQQMPAIYHSRLSHLIFPLKLQIWLK